MNNKNYVPISEKVLLTIEEAASYSNIGTNKIIELLNNPLCEFVLHVGKKDWLKEKNLKNIWKKHWRFKRFDTKIIQNHAE